MGDPIQITKATSAEAPELAAIHITARRDAMPYLPELHTNEEIRDRFTSRVAQSPDAFWVARVGQQIVGYLALYDHDYEWVAQ